MVVCTKIWQLTSSSNLKTVKVMNVLIYFWEKYTNYILILLWRIHFIRWKCPFEQVIILIPSPFYPSSPLFTPSSPLFLPSIWLLDKFDEFLKQTIEAVDQRPVWLESQSEPDASKPIREHKMNWTSWFFISEYLMCNKPCCEHMTHIYDSSTL